jgi:hypothetical protein
MQFMANLSVGMGRVFQHICLVAQMLAKGGDGAGFPAYLFGGTDVGEPAPTLHFFISFPPIVRR